MTTTFPDTLDTAASLPIPSPYGEHVPPGVIGDDLLKSLRDAVVAIEEAVGAADSQKRVHTRRSMTFDIDNGSGTTRDDVMQFKGAVTIVAARIVYVGTTSGTVAGASVSLGTTLGGVDIVAAVNLGNAQPAGTVTDLTVLTAADVNKIAADGKLFIRHTGIASTAAGEYIVEVDYTYD